MYSKECLIRRQNKMSPNRQGTDRNIQCKTQKNRSSRNKSNIG